MAPVKLTEYEGRRLENIKRNDEMLAALKVQSRATDLSARQRAKPKSYKVIPKKKPKTETPVVIRRSLRSRGISPDSSTADSLKDDYSESPSKMKTPKGDSLTRELGPISMREAFSGTDSTDDKPVLGVVIQKEDVVQGRIMYVEFFPCQDRRMVVVGNKFGDVGFWNVDPVEDNDGIYIYHSHPAPISGIVIQPFSMSKMFTCCYGGFIRLMDVEKEMFDLVYSGSDSIYSIAQRPNDVKSLYFSEGQGDLTIWDERAGKLLPSWGLHESRINTISFSACDTNIMATSSSDGTTCIWDLRKVVADKPKTLNTVEHKGAVHSAYFSPSGSILATTSHDNTIGLSSGANYENLSKVHHCNRTRRWISSFRGIWGWDDSYVFIENRERGVDVISTTENRCTDTLLSPEMSVIPSRFAVHLGKPGMLAGVQAAVRFIYGCQSTSCYIMCNAIRNAV